MEFRNKKMFPEEDIKVLEELNINASFDIWQPYSEAEYNQALATMKNAGILSQKTSVEMNTVSRPDEVERIKKEEQETLEKELEKTRRMKEVEAKYAKTNANAQKEE